MTTPEWEAFAVQTETDWAALDAKRELLAEQAYNLVLNLSEAVNDLCGDYAAEGGLPPHAIKYLDRLNRAHGRAVLRLVRRGGSDPYDAAAYAAEQRRIDAN